MLIAHLARCIFLDRGVFAPKLPVAEALLLLFDGETASAVVLFAAAVFTSTAVAGFGGQSAPERMRSMSAIPSSLALAEQFAMNCAISPRMRSATSSLRRRRK